MRAFSRTALACIALLLCLEAAFRAYLYLRNPEFFAYSKPDERFVVTNRPMWRYNADYGYEYVAKVSIANALIEGGKVTLCGTSDIVNEQGNIGPSVPDYASAEVKVVVFGDSFTASEIDGVTWPSILQGRLEERLGRKVRVLNFARDGYGALQMIDLAAAKIPEMKPDFVLFAVNSTTLVRGRTWRMLVGSGEDERILTSREKGNPPADAASTDIGILDSQATAQWCRDMLASADSTADPVVRRAVAKSGRLKSRGKRADPFDLTASYVLDQIWRANPFASQWARLPPGTNEQIKLTDFTQDTLFNDNVQRILSTDTPFMLVHLPMGVSIRAGQEFLFGPGDKERLESLETALKVQTAQLSSHLGVRPEDGMRLCKAENDCHPSIFGMNAYAEAIAQLLRDKIAR